MNRLEGLQGTHWIVSSIEHQSVLECFVEIEKRGGLVSHVDPNEKGIVTPDVIQRALRKETLLVSVGWANSETGMVQPIRDIAFVLREHEKRENSSVLLHADAGEAPLYLFPHVHTLGVDLFTLGSGKLYGPRGIGALYIGKRAELSPLMVGGSQERGLRSGTESPSLAAGFATALETASKERKHEGERVGKLRNRLASRITSLIAGAVINGDLKHALPHMLSISIPNINSEYVVLALDKAGIACSTKSACSEGRVNESHVVAAMVGEAEAWRARNTVRLSLGLETTPREIERCAQELSRIILQLPVFEV